MHDPASKLCQRLQGETLERIRAHRQKASVQVVRLLALIEERLLDVDLTVSALHRILVRDGDLERLFGLDAAYVAARDLPFARPAPPADVTYVHILCDKHECILANGCESESLFPGDVLHAALSLEDLAIVRDIACGVTQTAYPCLTSQEAAVWAAAYCARERQSA